MYRAIIVFGLIAGGASARADDGVKVLGAEQGPVTIQSTTTKDGVTLARVLSHASVAASGPGGTATAHGVSYEDICELPCSFEVSSGRFELLTYGKATTPGHLKTTLRPGSYTMHAKTGSLALRSVGMWGGILGLTGALLGVGALTQRGVPRGLSLGLLGGGLVLTGGSAALYFTNGTRLQLTPGGVAGTF